MELTAERKDFQELKAKHEVHKSAGVVGIDIAKNKHFAVLLDPVGQTIVPPFSFANSSTRFDALMDRVREMESSRVPTGLRHSSVSPLRTDRCGDRDQPK